MNCPMCFGETKILATRKDCESVHRRRICIECRHVFFTAEYEMKDDKEYKRVQKENIRKDLRK